MSRKQAAFRLGIANGILFNLGVAFADPNTVLPVFVSRLTEAKAAVGLLSALGIGGWLLPQLLCANYMQHRPYKMGLYRATALVRSASWLLVVPAAFLLAGHAPGLALALFFVGFALFTLGGGAGSIAFMDVVAKTVPTNRLGSFFGARAIGGGLLAIPAGFLVRHVLGPGGPGFPASFGVLFLLSAVICTAGLACFAFIREPVGESHPEREPLLRFLAGAPGLLVADPNFRRLLAASVCLAAVGMVAPFYIIFGRERLDMPAGMAGAYLSAQMLGSVLSNVVWMPLGNRHSGKVVLYAAGLVATAVPLGALAIAWRQLPAGQGQAALYAVFFAMGASGVGGFISFTKYLLELAPAADRPRYVGAFNTFGAAAAVFPVAAGLLIQHTSFRLAFGVAAAAGGLALLTISRLADLTPSDAPVVAAKGAG